MTKTNRFAPMFKTGKVVTHCERVFKEKKKEWDVNMVARAMVIQIDANQPVSLVNAWHKLGLGTQRAHALQVLETFMANRKVVA